MTDLTAFLKARLDEDERIAREADGISRDAVLGLYEDLIMSRPLDDERRVYGIHIGTFTSSRMLWDIAAKRQMLDEHAPTSVMVMSGDGLDNSGIYCRRCSPSDPNARTPYPCRTLRLLALPYMSHHEHQKEWLP